MNLNEGMLEKAKTAKTLEEFTAVAKENGVELTNDEAETYFAQLNPKTGELNDDELDNVAGGKKCGTLYDDGRPIVIPSSNTCEYWKDKTTFEVIPEGGKCSSCIHCHTRKFGWVCMANERYDN